MKKFMFIVLALFGFSTIADMHSGMGMDGMGMDHMSDMVGDTEDRPNHMSEKESDSGFVGSFSLRYKPIGFVVEGEDDVSYRARVGWKGNANDQVKWAVVLSTDTEQSFSTLNLGNINFEQAYVSYNPIENLYVKVGKMSWTPDFNKVGVLMSEQIYKEGAKVKYSHDVSDNSKVFGKVGAYRLVGGANAPLQDGTTLEGKVGVKFDVSDYETKVYAKGVYDGLFKEDSKDGQILTQAGVMVQNAEMVVPVGVFAHYLANSDAFGDPSYTAGVSVGKAGKFTDTDAGDFGVAVSYYDVDGSNYRTAWLNEDYVQGAGSGVAVRAQYNVWDNSSLAVKYAYDLGDNVEEENNVVAELAFVF